jgi:hypothetical protein
MSKKKKKNRGVKFEYQCCDRPATNTHNYHPKVRQSLETDLSSKLGSNSLSFLFFFSFVNDRLASPFVFVKPGVCLDSKHALNTLQYIFIIIARSKIYNSSLKKSHLWIQINEKYINKKKEKKKEKESNIVYILL